MSRPRGHRQVTGLQPLGGFRNGVDITHGKIVLYQDH